MSLHLLDNNAIFFHIPRLGGRWVGAVLSKTGVRMIAHHRLGGNKNSYKELLERDFPIENQFLFTFVRHPVAWYRSYWACRVEKGWRVDWIDKFKADTFEKFMENMANTNRPYVSEMFYHYIGKPKMMNFVGYNENMAIDLMHILDFLNIKFDRKEILKLSPVNASILKPKCSKELIDKIINIEHKIITEYYQNTPFENYIYEFVKGT